MKIVDRGWQFTKFAKKLHLRCLTGFSQDFNTRLELRDLFTYVFVCDTLNILKAIIQHI